MRFEPTCGSQSKDDSAGYGQTQSGLAEETWVIERALEVCLRSETKKQTTTAMKRETNRQKIMTWLCWNRSIHKAVSDVFEKLSLMFLKTTLSSTLWDGIHTVQSTVNSQQSTVASPTPTSYCTILVQVLVLPVVGFCVSRSSCPTTSTNKTWIHLTVMLQVRTIAWAVSKAPTKYDM